MQDIIDGLLYVLSVVGLATIVFAIYCWIDNKRLEEIDRKLHYEILRKRNTK